MKSVGEDEEHLKRIVEILTESIPPRYGLCSIILYGGFARGEGRMIEGIKGKIPYGDYDLMLITRQSLPDQLIKNLLEGRIYKEVMFGTSIDITNETLSTLRAINCDLSSYDLIKTGRTIWGEQLLDKIEMSIEDIPLISFWRILNNRFNVILMEYELFEGRIALDKMVSLKKSVLKLYLDMGGYLAFRYKKYSPFYEERLNNLRGLNLKAFFPGLVDKIEIATREKLNPERSGEVRPEELREALGYGLMVTKYILAEIMRQDLTKATAEEITGLIYNRLPRQYYREFIAWALRDRFPRAILRRILPCLSLGANIYENIYFRRWAITRDRFCLRYEWRSPIMVNMAVTIPLVFYLAHGEKEDYLRQAGNYLKRYIAFGNKEYNFAEIKEANTSLWLGYTRRARKRNFSRALSDLLLND